MLREVRVVLINTPGIEQVLEVLQFDNMDTIDKIKVKVGEIVSDSLKDKTIVVRVKRTGTHPFKSIHIEKTVGGYLLAHTEAKAVDLRNAEVTVKMELIESQLNIITTKYKGLSGFPIGTQGDILSLMSGGFDSTVASEKIADELEIDALLTGESVAQVSSQTLRNLALIDQVSNKLILRPLSTMNKPEIMSIADDIGTRHFAENMPEYCGVISQNPITHGSFKRMEKEAKKFNYEVLDKAVESAQHIYVDEVIDDVSNLAPIEVINNLDSGDFVVIDIRTEDECIQTSCESIKIPFHKLKTEFDKLPQDKEYLLYCEKGIMSQLHAQYLRDAKNTKNVRVYRPL